MSNYEYLPPAEIASLPAPQRARYEAQRRAFDHEVARLVADGARTGVIPLAGRTVWVLRCIQSGCLRRRGTTCGSPCAATRASMIHSNKRVGKSSLGRPRADTAIKEQRARTRTAAESGSGSRRLVAFQVLQPQNKPLSLPCERHHDESHNHSLAGAQGGARRAEGGALVG